MFALFFQGHYTIWFTFRFYPTCATSFCNNITFTCIQNCAFENNTLNYTVLSLEFSFEYLNVSAAVLTVLSESYVFLLPLSNVSRKSWSKNYYIITLSFLYRNIITLSFCTESTFSVSLASCCFFLLSFFHHLNNSSLTPLCTAHSVQRPLSPCPSLNKSKGYPYLKILDFSQLLLRMPYEEKNPKTVNSQRTFWSVK